MSLHFLFTLFCKQIIWIKQFMLLKTQYSKTHKTINFIT